MLELVAQGKYPLIPSIEYRVSLHSFALIFMRIVLYLYYIHLVYSVLYNNIVIYVYCANENVTFPPLWRNQKPPG